MNPEIKAQWIDALLSGKYEQGEGYLRKAGAGEGGRDEYCCLGVLCDLYVKSEENSAHPQGPIEWERVDRAVPAYSVGERASFLPGDVMEWAGLTSSQGAFVNDEGWDDDLAERNDEGWTFEEIARVIEEKF